MWLLRPVKNDFVSVITVDPVHVHVVSGSCSMQTYGGTTSTLLTLLLCIAEQRTRCIWLSHTSLEGLCRCMRWFLRVLLKKCKRSTNRRTTCQPVLRASGETRDIRTNRETKSTLMLLPRNPHHIFCQRWCFKMMQQDRDGQ